MPYSPEPVKKKTDSTYSEERNVPKFKLKSY